MRTFEELTDAVSKAISINDAASLMECADELLALATPEAEVFAHEARGWAHYLRGNYPAALEHYHRALAMNEEMGDSSSVASAIGNIGVVYDSTGNYPAALEYFHRALAMLEEQGNRNGVAIVTGNIGLVHDNTGNYPAALEHFHRALAMFEELGNRSWVAINTANIGLVHRSTGNYSEALEHFHRALAMHDELGNSAGVALVTGNILAVMIASELYDDAEALLQTMDVMQTDVPGVVVQREQNRASLQEHRGSIDEAKATLLAALLIAQEHSLASKQAGLHEALRDLALKQNDLAGYVEHNNEFTRITEEINGKDTATKLAMQEKQREIDAVQREHQKHMAVLHSTLPKHIADRVARGEEVNDHYDNACVLFLDIVGFTTISDQLTSDQVVRLLGQIFTALDMVCEQHDVVKIKTIGDSYMAVAFPQESSSSEQRVANAALDMRDAVSKPITEYLPDLPEGLLGDLYEVLQVRIGLHVGPVTAGVIGTARMQYDVWGDTVNVASRMESSGEAGRIHVSSSFAHALELRHQGDTGSPFPIPHSLRERGTLEIKGKGPMTTYWLEGA